MQITAALLCDSATVREGLLHLLGGGISRAFRPEYPAPLGVSLAVLLQMSRLEAERPHQLEIAVIDEDGQRIAGLIGGFQSQAAADQEPGETINAPLTFDLRNVEVKAPGVYSVEVMIDGRSDRSLPFRMMSEPSAGLNLPPGLQSPPPAP